MPCAPLVAALVCVCLLSACSNPLKGFAPTEAEVYRQGWYEPSPRAALAERYCYETLAEVDCHSEPEADAGNRQVGWFDAPLAN